MPLLLFLVAIVHVPDIVESHSVGGWLLLAAGIPVVALFTPAVPWRTADTFLAAWLGFLVLSLLWTPSLWDGIHALSRWVIIFVAFRLAGGWALRPCLTAFALGTAATSALIVASEFGWRLDWVADPSPPSGLMMNKNIAAGTLALAALGAWSARRPWLALIQLPGVVLPVSKAALLALAGGVLTAAPRRVFWMLGVCGVAGVALGAVLLYAPASPGIEDRWHIWQEAAAAVTWEGAGVGAWRIMYPVIRWGDELRLFAMGATVGQPHNEYLLAIFEAGPAAALAFLAFGCAAWDGHRERAVAVLVAGGALAAVADPFHQPGSAVFLAVVAGALARDRDLLGGLWHRLRVAIRRDPLAQRGERDRPGADPGRGPLPLARAASHSECGIPRGRSEDAEPARAHGLAPGARRVATSSDAALLDGGRAGRRRGSRPGMGIHGAAVAAGAKLARGSGTRS